MMQPCLIYQHAISLVALRHNPLLRAVQLQDLICRPGDVLGRRDQVLGPGHDNAHAGAAIATAC